MIGKLIAFGSEPRHGDGPHVARARRIRHPRHQDHGAFRPAHSQGPRFPPGPLQYHFVEGFIKQRASLLPPREE